LKEDRLRGGLRFLEPPAQAVFYRGQVMMSYTDDLGQEQKRYFHLVQRRGQKGEPLLTFTLEANQVKDVKIDLVYPPDATPPQVLTVTTVEGGEPN
jgi:hypothetical protein